MCGVFGVIGNQPIAEAIYHAIIQLQHRGQDAAGIFTYDPITGKYATHKDKGLVTEVFNSDNLPLPNASWGIGHVRYSTIGKGSAKDTQPLYAEGNQTVAIAHNGNVVNYVPLRKQLQEQGVVIETECDVEAILHQFARALPKGEIGFKEIKQAVKTIHETTTGSYSCVALIAGKGMVAFRDPHGIRPLLYGKRPDIQGHGFSSESSSLLVLGFDQIEDVQPGEVVFVDDKYQVQREIVTKANTSICSFEFDYFSKPNTVIHEKEVYTVRSNLGHSLAKHIREAGIEADVVVPIPSTARGSGIALAESLGIAYREGFVKQDYIGRTFIMPTQGVRQSALKRKLAPVPSVFKGKRVILVDDSIVRGTVSKRVVTLAKQAGATEIYFASTYPPIRYPCVYGVDFPNVDHLIAKEKSIDEIGESIGVNKLIYNTVEDLHRSIGLKEVCAACLTGNYPTEMVGMEELQKLRIQDRQQMETPCKP